MPPPAALLELLRVQNGAVTVQQAFDSGLSRGQIRTLVAGGWTRPVQGVLVQPEPRDRFQAGLQAAFLACPEGVACHVTAGRIHELAGLPRWTESELPHLVLPSGIKRAQRGGIRLHFGVQRSQVVRRGGWPVTSLEGTVESLAPRLAPDDLVCLIDSALRKGWEIERTASNRELRRLLQRARSVADARSESALETKLRLLLVRSGLPPEVLQLRLFDHNGTCYARADFAWPNQRVIVEADGREYHDQPEALFRDRQKQNLMELAGWTVLRFTWHDVTRRPAWVLAQVRDALSRGPKS